MRQKLVYSTGGLFIILVIVAVIILGLPSHQKSAPQIGPHEHGSVSNLVSVTGADKLYQLLLSDQYSAVTSQLSAYVRSLDASAKTVAITAASTQLNSDGSINFSVSVDQGKSVFSVTLQKGADGSIVFLVPSQNYSTTLYPYGANNDSGND